MNFLGVSELSDDEMDRFESITEDWFMGYYRTYKNMSSYSSNQLTQYVLKNLDYPTLQINDVELTTEISQQQVSDFTNVIHLNLFLSYVQSTKDKMNRSTISYVQTPFKDDIANTNYGNLLRTNITSFAGVVLPIPLPKVGSIEGGEDPETVDIPTQQPEASPPVYTIPEKGNEHLLSYVALSGIGVCGAIIVAVCCFVLYKIYSHPKSIATNRSTIIEDDNTFSSPIPLSGIHDNYKKYYSTKKNNEDTNSINGGLTAVQSYAGYR
jgi:hypothetical protein